MCSSRLCVWQACGPENATVRCSAVGFPERLAAGLCVLPPQLSAAVRPRYKCFAKSHLKIVRASSESHNTPCFPCYFKARARLCLPGHRLGSRSVFVTCHPSLLALTSPCPQVVSPWWTQNWLFWFESWFSLMRFEMPEFLTPCMMGVYLMEMPAAFKSGMAAPCQPLYSAC